MSFPATPFGDSSFGSSGFGVNILIDLFLVYSDDAFLVFNDDQFLLYSR